ncbi:hypothetical protein COE55_20875, partial [Priestia megaterium]
GTKIPNLNQEPPQRGPSWHRLLGTLLSSQGTDAHLFRPCDLARGNRSNLAEPILAVKPPRGGRLGPGLPVPGARDVGDALSARHRLGEPSGGPLAGPATEIHL